MNISIMTGTFLTSITSGHITIGCRLPAEAAHLQEGPRKHRSLHLRINKAGLNDEDVFSPEVNMEFDQQNDLHISISGIEMSLGRHALQYGYFNPYTNSVQKRSPSLVISTDQMIYDRFEVSSFPNILGDFLLIEECWPNGPNGKQVIAVNLSALGLFEGLSLIRRDRVYFGSDDIGQLNRRWTDMLLFSARLNPDDTLSLIQWQQRSYEISRRLIDPYTKSECCTVRGFSSIRSEPADNQTVSRMKELFVRILQ